MPLTSSLPPPPVAEGHLCSPSPSKKQKGFASPPRGGDSLFAGCRTQATHLRTMWDLTETQGPRGRERGGSFQSNTDTQTSKNVNTEWETFARPPDPVPAAEGSLQRGWTSRARLWGGGGEAAALHVPPACPTCPPHMHSGRGWRRDALQRPSADEVESEAVHEDGLQAGHSHGQVHAQLVLGPLHQHPFCRCLRQDLQAQRPDLGQEGRKEGRGAQHRLRGKGEQKVGQNMACRDKRGPLRRTGRTARSPSPPALRRPGWTKSLASRPRGSYHEDKDGQAAPAQQQEVARLPKEQPSHEAHDHPGTEEEGGQGAPPARPPPVMPAPPPGRLCQAAALSTHPTYLYPEKATRSMVERSVLTVTR